MATFSLMLDWLVNPTKISRSKPVESPFFTVQIREPPYFFRLKSDKTTIFQARITIFQDKALIFLRKKTTKPWFFHGQTTIFQGATAEFVRVEAVGSVSPFLGSSLGLGARCDGLGALPLPLEPCWRGLRVVQRFWGNPFFFWVISGWCRWIWWMFRWFDLIWWFFVKDFFWDLMGMNRIWGGFEECYGDLSIKT